MWCKEENVEGGWGGGGIWGWNDIKLPKMNNLGAIERERRKEEERVKN